MTQRETRHRVLVVEDDPSTSRALGRFLELIGCEVLSAQDGEQAVAMARGQRPDLVLTDLGLPKLDGYGVLDVLQAKLPEIPVIVMTGSGQIASAVRAMRAGADNYLEKPLDFEALSVAIERALERRRLRAEAESFFALSPDMLCIAGFDGSFKRLNAAWERTLGWTPEELRARPWTELVHPDDQEAMAARTEELRGGRATLSFETRTICKDGSCKWLLWSAGPVRGTETIHAVARDMTEEKRAEQELRHAKTEAESANRELEAFSYSVAHDLRAPLRAIEGFSEALQEDHGGDLRPEGMEYLRRVCASARHMAGLIDALLELSRVSRAGLLRAPVDLCALAQGICARLQEASPGRHVEVTVQGGLRAMGDANLLGAVLQNLLGNAWKFTSKRPIAHVEVGSETEDGRTVFFVRDDGAGFDQAYASRLFGAFQRLHSHAEFEGSGIGLATVRRIVRRHGGEVWARAEVDRGATFYFTLESPPAEETRR